MNAALLAIPLAPLAASITVVVLGDRRRDAWCRWMPVAGATVSLLLLVGTRDPPQVSADWLRAGDLTLTVGLQLDALSRVVALVVTTVAALVSVYAAGYMTEWSSQDLVETSWTRLVGGLELFRA